MRNHSDEPLLRLDQDTLDELMRLIANERVSGILAKAAFGLSEEEAARYSLCDDGSPERRAYELIEGFYGIAGRPVLKFDYADFWYYYYPTEIIGRHLRQLDIACFSGSQLQRQLEGAPPLLMQLRIERAIDSCRHDDVVIDYESARNLLLFDMTPRTVPERIVRNAFELFGDMDEYAHRPWTVEMAADVFERLNEGVSECDDSWLDSTSVAEHSTQLYSYPTPRSILQAICDIANGEGIHEGSHPLLVSIIIERMLSIYRPFPSLGGVAGMFLWHCYVVKEGFPTLQYAPYSTIQGGEPRHYSKSAAREEPRPDWNGWTPMPDFTSSFTRDLGHLARAVDMLRSRVRDFEARQAALCDLGKVDPSLNGRQLGIMGKCLRVPSTAFRVSYHRTWNAIGNTAARQDFLNLEARGYLTSTREGHAVVYRATPLVEERFGEDTAATLTDIWRRTRHSAG